MSPKIKTSHALRILSRVTRMRENEFICDFTIKVGEKSFPTHRTILAASSDYFEALFSSKMKEAKQGFVEMKGLGVKGVQQSLEFMYTGDTQITLESVDDTLHAADLFQLDDLKNLCFQYLTQNLSPSNCLAVANLAEKYNRQDVRNESEKVVISNFQMVISSDLFPLISQSDLLRYISNLEHQTSWQAAITWAKDKEQFSELFEAMDFQKFPFKFLWETVLEEPLIKQSDSIKNKVVKGLFSDPEQIQQNLAIENCILIKTLACNHNIAGRAAEVIAQFMEENFEGLAGHPSFNDLSKRDLLLLLESPATKCSSEEVKWEAALKWVKHDLRRRKNVFSDVFHLIKLEKLSIRFLKNYVRSESLVLESRKCMETLTDVLLTKSLESEENSLVVYQPPGQMRYPLWALCDIRDHTGRDISMVEIKYTFSEGSWNGIRYPDTELRGYVPCDMVLRVREAFNARQIFKLQRKPEGMGEIVWGDIPHMTRICGGPDNNGCPDPDYPDILDKALRAKGF